MDRHNSCLSMLKCEVAMASLSTRFLADANFFHNAARVDIDFFSTAKNLCVSKNTRLRLDVAFVVL